MTAPPVVTVLGSAPTALQAVRSLLLADLTLHSWILPSHCSAREARALARSASDWHRRLADCDIMLTLFDAPYVLESVVVPHVLPAARPGTLWLQMGPAPSPHVTQLTELARCLGVAVAHASMSWSGDKVTALGAPPSLSFRHGSRQADVDLVYGSAIAGLTNAGVIDLPSTEDLSRAGTQS
ncbi:hypothetical protein SMCF_8267 [Streptomyces coelicoflavus ZG0656]|nr:hypothetical protein SMCF_8267 [Streptomyces coelicoflavus ZG0656]